MDNEWNYDYLMSEKRYKLTKYITEEEMENNRFDLPSKQWKPKSLPLPLSPVPPAHLIDKDKRMSQNRNVCTDCKYLVVERYGYGIEPTYMCTPEHKDNSTFSPIHGNSYRQLRPEQKNLRGDCKFFVHKQNKPKKTKESTTSFWQKIKETFMKWIEAL